MTTPYQQFIQNATPAIFAEESKGVTDPFKLTDLAEKSRNKAHLLAETLGVRPDANTHEPTQAYYAARAIYLDYHQLDVTNAPGSYWVVKSKESPRKGDPRPLTLGVYHGFLIFGVARLLDHYLKRLKAAALTYTAAGCVPEVTQDERNDYCAARSTEFYQAVNAYVLFDQQFGGFIELDPRISWNRTEALHKLLREDRHPEVLKLLGLKEKSCEPDPGDQAVS